MMVKKRIIAFILFASICMTILAGVGYAETSDIDISEMAVILNKLNILQGSNGDFLLDDRIDRAQAVALIIRILGKEDYIKENADDLRYTRFTDVTAASWYAPYVGYSTQNNIVGGNPDGSFAPLDHITEKAFIKMVLCALGYEYGEDFDWTNVYQKAYETGIVIDSSYETRIQDDSEYLRSGAVEVLYRALNTYRNGTEKKLAYALVEEGVMTSEELASSGIFKDDTITDIDSIVALAPNNVEVVFNEIIQSVKTSDIKIINNKTEAELDVKSVGLSDNTIQIITVGQAPGATYSIQIESVTDSDGNISNRLSGVFDGYTPKKTISDFFKVSMVEQLSANVVKVIFTHPVNINSENPMYYDLYEDGKLLVDGSVQNMTVKKLQASDNAVSILLKDDEMEKGAVYTLKISGKLTSTYGVKLNEGQDVRTEFVAMLSQPEQLEVLSVKAMSVYSVRIMFNQEVDMAWAGKRLNYTVYDEDGMVLDVDKVIESENDEYVGREVMLSLTRAIDRTEDYKVKIEYIPDVYKQSAITEEKYSFSGTYPREVPLAIKRIENEYNNIAELIFNKPLDPDSAVDASNYHIRGNNDTTVSTSPERVYYSEQDGNYSVKLFLPSGATFSNKKKYWITVARLKDKLGESEETVIQKEFTANRVDSGKPQISDAVTISKDSLKVIFDVEIAFDPRNISTDNYTLECDYAGEILKMVPIAVNYIKPDTLVLRFDELDPTKAYKLSFDYMKDYSEIYTRTSVDGENTIDVRWGE